MIDIESLVYSHIASKLRSKYNPIFITGEYVKTPPSFPCVSLVEMDNSVNTSTSDSENIENHARVMYELNIYSNKTTGKKTECKSIANEVDNMLATLGFTRIMLQPIPNFEDSSIYRITGCYTATVSKNNEIFRR
ncbi:MAG: hypothetical protein ACK5L6_13555 [Anaerorhabdus sp.]|uniref:hypothetical protein n=1 Tax=Anaerorhabdus sp. TaxID=1872524 RepID=UPI003A851E24